MKWFFLVNDTQYLMEFLGKIAHQATAEGDECVVVINSKIAEYKKKKFFPDNVKFISRIDWCVKNYKKEQERFGSLSWKKLFSAFDRYKLLDFNYNSSFRMLSSTYQFFEFLFQKEKPDIIIGEIVSGLFHEIAYYFCKINNILYLGLRGSKFNNRIDIYDLKFTCSKYEKTFKEINHNSISEKEKEFARDFIEKFISHKQISSYVDLSEIHFSQFGFTKYWLRRIKEFYRGYFQYFLNRKHFKEFDYESEAVLKYVFRASRIIGKRNFKVLFPKNIFAKLNNNDKFFLFPLHFQPETTTCVFATYYCNQLNTVKNIAFSLPFPYKLYVKEHPASVGKRSKNFYKKLREIPNVVLISPDENVEEIIRKSSGVVVLTGFIGMEASLTGKPVYVLGDVFYFYHPLCRKVKNFEELKNRIQEDIINRPNTDNLENINYRFITSYFRNTIAGNIAAGSSNHDTNNYKRIYRDIKKILEKERTKT